MVENLIYTDILPYTKNETLINQQAPKKKLTKKEKQRLEAERAEAARIVQEKELLV